MLMTQVNVRVNSSKLRVKLIVSFLAVMCLGLYLMKRTCRIILLLRPLL